MVALVMLHLYPIPPRFYPINSVFYLSIPDGYFCTMATQFVQSYLDGAQYVPTSSVSSIKATTDKSRVLVSMSCEDGLNGDIETIISTYLYSFDGIVELSEVGALVESYFRTRNKIAGSITVTFDDVSMDIHFLYSEYILPEAFDPEQSFFVATMTQRVHLNSVIAIAAVSRGSRTPFIIKAVGHSSADGSLALVQKSVFKSFNEEYTVYFGVSEIVKWATSPDVETQAVCLRDVLYFSVEYAGIQKLCFVVPGDACLSFFFRNRFNVKEVIDVVGVVATKPKSACSIAIVGGTSIQYDRELSRSYQVQVEAIPSDEIALFEQFVTSNSVTMSIDGTEYDIIITDHTLEESTDDGQLTTIKFDWQFADKRPRLFDSLIDGILPPRRNIFDNSYSKEYE